LLGINLLQQPLIEIFHLRSNPVMAFVFPFPLLLAAWSFHNGDRVFSRMVGVESKWLPWTRPLIAAGIIGIITFILPRPSSVTDPMFFFKLGGILGGWVIIAPTTSAILLRQAAKRAPKLYQPATHKLYQSMFAIIAVTSLVWISWLFNGPTLTGTWAYTTFGLLIIEGSMLLRAGYAFSRAREY